MDETTTILTELAFLEGSLLELELHLLGEVKDGSLELTDWDKEALTKVHDLACRAGHHLSKQPQTSKSDGECDCYIPVRETRVSRPNPDCPKCSGSGIIEHPPETR